MYYFQIILPWFITYLLLDYYGIIRGTENSVTNCVYNMRGEMFKISSTLPTDCNTVLTSYDIHYHYREANIQETNVTRTWG